MNDTAAASQLHLYDDDDDDDYRGNISCKMNVLLSHPVFITYTGLVPGIHYTGK